MDADKMTAGKIKIGRSAQDLEVGQSAEYTRTFTREDVDEFARLTGDMNPFHFDGPFASQGRFGKPIVHGLLTGSLLTYFGGTLFPGPGFLAVEISFKFKKPVFIGEILRAVATVTELNKDTGWAEFEVRCFKSDNNEEVLSATCKGLPTALEIDNSAEEN